jgi:hypothetical protein
MDAVILFVMGIAIFLISYVWKTDFEKKQYLKYKHEREREIEKIENKKNANEGHEQLKGILISMGELEKGNYIHDSALSDGAKKFLEKRDKKIDEETEKLIRDIKKTQAKNKNDINESIWTKEFYEKKLDNSLDNSNRFPSITEKFGLILSLLSVILAFLDYIKR